MSRLVWMIAGLLGGIIVGQNAEPMENPSGGAVVLALLVGCGVCWWAAYRGKSQAVATAVAVAVAQVNADLEANAAAIAQAAVHMHFGSLGLPVPDGLVVADGDGQAQRPSLAAPLPLPLDAPSVGLVVDDVEQVRQLVQLRQP